MYGVNRRVVVTAKGSGYEGTLGHVTERNYLTINGRRRASYLVTFDNGGDLLLGSDGLRAADYCCESCGRWLAGQPHRRADHYAFGELEESFDLCFLCSGPPAEREAWKAEQREYERLAPEGANR